MEIVVEAPDSPRALTILADYWREIVGRYHERAATDADVEQAFHDFPSAAFAPPTGVLVVAINEQGPVGCAGLTWLPGGDEAALGRVFVQTGVRRTGLARRLVGEAERRAGAHGVSAIRLEVRGDLVEARALYDACGYSRVPAFSNARHADAWFRKQLR